MDEPYEVLTLIQTKKVRRVPIVRVGSDYWERAVIFELQVEEFSIDEEDTKLVSIVKTVEEILSVISDYYVGHPDAKLASSLSDSTV